MSSLIKQAINDLSSETSDIQVVLSQRADVAQTYTKFDTYSTAEVDAKFTNLIDSAPATLNTLNELATALNDDSSFASTVANSLAKKAPLDSPIFTGSAAAEAGALHEPFFLLKARRTMKYVSLRKERGTAATSCGRARPTRP